LELVPLPALADNYIWLLADDHGNALVVDPSEAAPVEAALAERGLTLRSILLTHHHHDHIGGVADLVARHHQVEVIAPVDDRIPVATRRVGHGEEVIVALPSSRFEVIAVPGHTTSHIAYAGEGLVFCGDTLFSVGCGRLFEGTPAQMLASLDRLTVLPDATLVCCAHEYTQANARFAITLEPENPALHERMAEIDEQRRQGLPTVPSSMAGEKATNPFLRVDSPAIIEWAARQHAGADRVARFAAVRQAKDHFR
jgi:hydroxyacylglutathione hydrolase